MPNCMSCSLLSVCRSGAATEQPLERLHRLSPARLLEDLEARLGLLDAQRDERGVLALHLPLELVLDVAQVELLLVDDALEELAILTSVEAGEVDVELVVGDALDGVDTGEDHDAAHLGRQLLDHLPLRGELLRAVREEPFDVGRE